MYNFIFTIFLICLLIFVCFDKMFFKLFVKNCKKNNIEYYNNYYIDNLNDNINFNDVTSRKQNLTYDKNKYYDDWWYLLNENNFNKNINKGNTLIKNYSFDFNYDKYKNIGNYNNLMDVDPTILNLNSETRMENEIDYSDLFKKTDKSNWIMDIYDKYSWLNYLYK